MQAVVRNVESELVLVWHHRGKEKGRGTDERMNTWREGRIEGNCPLQQHNTCYKLST